MGALFGHFYADSAFRPNFEILSHLSWVTVTRRRIFCWLYCTLYSTPRPRM